MLTLLPQLRRSTAVPTRRIGIDVGTRALKLVQAERTPDGWRAVSPLLIPHPCDAPATVEDMTQGFIKAALESVMPNGAATNLPAGCVFGMDLSCLQTLELPPGTDAEMRQMAEAELRETPEWSNRDCAFDVWPETALSTKEGGANMVNVLSISTDAASTVANDLLGFGIQCDTVDGLPFAAARAVSLTWGKRPQPIALLDWGASAATFVLCRNGRPAFTRRFRDCGFTRCVEQIQQRLDLPVGDCHHLLQAIGMYPRDVCPVSSVSRVVSAAAANGIRLIAEEIRRTVRYLKADSGIQPQQLILLGGGGCLRHVATRIEELTGLATRPWRFPHHRKNTDDHLSDAVFATAFAAALGGLK